MKSRSESLIIFLSGLILGTAIGISLSNLGLIPSVRRAPVESLRDTSAATPGAQPAHMRGDLNARVTLEEFADFQCPPCRSLYPELKMIEAEYGARLRVIFRHFPLESIHRNAVAASMASEAAAVQGRFWEMHDRLYETQAEWSEAGDAEARQLFIRYARDLGLDVERFARDINGADARERIRLDQQRGESIDIPGTPTLFINGHQVPSASMTPEGIRGIINAALNGSTP
jgi:protein-disulfide isomerase